MELLDGDDAGLAARDLRDLPIDGITRVWVRLVPICGTLSTTSGACPLLRYGCESYVTALRRARYSPSSSA